MEAMNTKPEALFFAELLEQAAGDYTAWDKKTGYAAAAEMRRLHEANEAFGKRQEWWNERMFELEQQRDELLNALHCISLASKDSGSTREGMGLYARAAIAKAEGSND